MAEPNVPGESGTRPVEWLPGASTRRTIGLVQDVANHPAKSPTGSVQRLVQEPYPLLLRTSLALALFGGFGLGPVLLLSFTLRFPLPLNNGALVQVHGQVQALGFLALFIIAVGSRLLPRFHGTRLDAGSQVSIGGLTLAACLGRR